jgi:LPS sulfotransferase NodH
MATLSQVESTDWDLPEFTGRPSIYVIASQPRCGSHHLADLLRATGTAGVPLEYFHTGHWKNWVRRTGRSDPGGAFRLLWRVRTTPNGVFGLKAHWRQFQKACQLRLEPDLAGARFVQLTREDLLGQAISYVIASQTGSWDSGTAPRESPEFSFPAIRAAIERIERERSGWNRFFASTGIQPLRITYEELTAAPDPTMQQVCTHIGANWTGAPRVERAGVQRTDLSAAWRERFLDTIPTLHETGCFWRGEFGRPD